MNEIGQARLSALLQRWTIILVILALPLVSRPSPVPKRLPQSLRQAEAALEQGDRQQAIEALSIALNWSSELNELRLLTASLALEDGQAALVRLALDTPALAQSAKANCLRHQAALIDLGPQAALKRLQAFPTACAPPLVLTQRLAEQALAEAQFETAAELYRALSRIQPDNLSLERNIALAQSLQDPAEAAGLLRQYQRQVETDDPLILDLIGTLEQAAAAENQAFSYASIGQVFLQHQRWLEASLAFQRSIEIDPEYVDARAYYGLALDQLGRTEQARQQFERAQQQAPLDPLPAYLLSRYWLRAQDPRQAQRYARIAHLVEPSSPAYSAQLASVYAASGDLPRAEALFLEAVELSGESPEFLGLLADFYLQHETDRAAALRTARRAYQLAPTPQRAETLGYAHYLTGELRLAARFLGKAIQLEPELASAHYHYGLVMADLGRGQQAAEQWHLVVALDESGRWGDLAARALARLE